MPEIPTQKGLKKGDKSFDVNFMQSYLKLFGYMDLEQENPFKEKSQELSTSRTLSESQVFDDKTEAALKHLQEFYQLPQTGILDDKTIYLMTQPRCGYPDIKFSDQTKSLYPGHPKWSTFKLSYQIVNYSNNLSQDAIKSAIAYAFAQWSSVVPFNISYADSQDAPIKLSFATRSHKLGNGYCTPFDGEGGVVAHGFPPTMGVIHFDDDESWTDNPNSPWFLKDFYAAALHESGHILGLDHSRDPNAVMYAIHTNGRRELYDDDIKNIQLLYGIK